MNVIGKVLNSSDTASQHLEAERFDWIAINTLQFVSKLLSVTLAREAALLAPCKNEQVEVVRIGTGLKARPDVVVTEITREVVTVRYQGQLF